MTGKFFDRPQNRAAQHEPHEADNHQAGNTEKCHRGTDCSRTEAGYVAWGIRPQNQEWDSVDVVKNLLTRYRVRIDTDVCLGTDLDFADPCTAVCGGEVPMHVDLGAFLQAHET